MWKMKNKLKHGEKMTLDKMWSCLVRLQEGYKPCIVSRVIYRKAPHVGFYKSTTNGASKGNPCPVLVVSVLGIGKILEGAWDVPWCISPLITKIRWLMRNEHVEVKHVSVEGNKVVDFFSNIIFFFAGIEDKVYESFKEVPREGKAQLILDEQPFLTLELLNSKTNYLSCR
ncbi:hypothetical protein H5410_051627, partial [Solanum commersonii]